MNNTVVLNGVKIYPFVSEKEFLEFTDDYKGILVAVNAEKILHATDRTREMIGVNVGYCDGAGAVMAVRQHGYRDVVKIRGCEVWLKIVGRRYRDSSFYLVGGRPFIIEETVARMKEDYPGINITGYRNGYFSSDEEYEALIEDIVRLKPDIVFVATGSPGQELLMERLSDSHKALYQGLGGSFDLYTGHVTGAPRWWVDHNLEWAYRLMREPGRIKRQIHLVRFFRWLTTGYFRRERG